MILPLAVVEDEASPCDWDLAMELMCMGFELTPRSGWHSCFVPIHQLTSYLLIKAAEATWTQGLAYLASSRAEGIPPSGGEKGPSLIPHDLESCLHLFTDIEP